MSVTVTVVPTVSIVPIISGVSLLGKLADEINETSEEELLEERLIISSTIRNKDLLNKALINLGAENISYSKKRLKASVDNFEMVFNENKTGMLDVEFIGEIEQNEAQNFVSELQNEYGKVIQEFVYIKLKEKAVEKNLTLEQEKIQSDQSIVLTYNING